MGVALSIESVEEVCQWAGGGGMPGRTWAGVGGRGSIGGGM